jgi:hypothetical protein
MNILTENNGKYSATRTVFLLWALVVLLAWCIISYRTGQLAEIPASVATIMGLLAGGKVVQKFKEP